MFSAVLEGKDTLAVLIVCIALLTAAVEAYVGWRGHRRRERAPPAAVPR